MARRVGLPCFLPEAVSVAQRPAKSPRDRGAITSINVAPFDAPDEPFRRACAHHVNPELAASPVEQMRGLGVHAGVLAPLHVDAPGAVLQGPVGSGIISRPLTPDSA